MAKKKNINDDKIKDYRVNNILIYMFIVLDILVIFFAALSLITGVYLYTFISFICFVLNIFVVKKRQDIKDKKKVIDKKK